MSPAKNGSYVESIIHRFGPFSDGQNAANITYYNGTIYGITVAGGVDNASCLSPQGAFGQNPHRVGCGTIYSVKPHGRDFRVLYRFQGNADGNWPLAGLVVSNGSLYGTTLLGGKFGAGVAYKLTP
ncbi:MAG TPA: choice-of-anchor tandem repeat GloVer-containing protein [Candidatus Baltobacteraceae bacterium]